MSEEDGNEDVSVVTLSLLNTRLQRLEFLLTGSTSATGIPEPASKPESSDDLVFTKLEKLEQDLEQLRKRDDLIGAVVQEIELLYSRFPDLFAPSTQTHPSDLSTLASIVLGQAPIFPETASRLSSLQSLQIPPAEQSVKLADLNPQIMNCQQQQYNLEAEINELRERSAKCLEWWVKTGVVGTNNLLEDWQDRISAMERQLARLERSRAAAEGYV